jgi:hypothetical protein
MSARIGVLHVCGEPRIRRRPAVVEHERCLVGDDVVDGQAATSCLEGEDGTGGDTEQACPSAGRVDHRSQVLDLTVHRPR